MNNHTASRDATMRSFYQMMLSQNPGVGVQDPSNNRTVRIPEIRLVMPDIHATIVATVIMSIAGYLLLSHMGVAVLIAIPMSILLSTGATTLMLCLCLWANRLWMLWKTRIVWNRFGGPVHALQGIAAEEYGGDEHLQQQAHMMLQVLENNHVLRMFRNERDPELGAIVFDMVFGGRKHPHREPPF